MSIPVWFSAVLRYPPRSPVSSSLGRHSDDPHSSGSSSPPPDKPEHNRTATRTLLTATWLIEHQLEPR